MQNKMGNRIERIKNCKVISFISGYYQKTKGKCQQHANESIENYDVTKRKKIAETYAHDYKVKSAITGVVGPLFLTLLIAVWRRPSDQGRILGFSGNAFYCFVLFAVTCIITIRYIYTFLQNDVWEEVKKRIDADEISIIRQENQDLIEKNEALESNNQRLSEFISIMAYLDNNEHESPQEALADRILTQLGPGEFSVGLYHAYGSNFMLATYTESRINPDIPSCYKKLLSKNNSKYHAYHFVEQLNSGTENQYCCYNKEEVKEKFRDAPANINQYACYAFNKDKKHRMLLEIIAYNNTSFKCQQDDWKNYFIKVFNIYIPIFVKYTKDDDIKELIKIG